MKAYITIYNKDRTTTKLVLTLDEAKARLTAKEYEKLVSFNGIHSYKMSGYVA